MVIEIQLVQYRHVKLMAFYILQINSTTLPISFPLVSSNFSPHLRSPAEQTPCNELTSMATTQSPAASVAASLQDGKVHLLLASSGKQRLQTCILRYRRLQSY